MAINAVTGTFTATGSSGTLVPECSQTRNSGAAFNVAVYGTFVGTVLLEKTFDGTNYVPVYRGNSATAISYTAPASEVVCEPEDGVAYRLRCSAFTSGTISYRISH